MFERIEIYEGVFATGILASNKNAETLKNCCVIKAEAKDDFLCKEGKVVFAEALNKQSQKGVCYLVVLNIDYASKEEQQKFVELVKDRIFFGFEIPDNCIVVFTCDKKQNYKNIDRQLYKFLTTLE